ncbi:MAG: DUF4097 family beta strand repeat-containing protein [Longimicrobiales bacterium]|nr:DUF4097 family beta strand repeat-containing protein [Longimicrobiales bacterium]
MKRMMTSVVTLGAALVAHPALGQEQYRLDGERVAIHNLAGRVEVVPGAGGEVTVHVARGGADAERLTVEVGEVRGVATLRVMYPADRVVYDRPGGGRFQSTFRVCEDGTLCDGGRRVAVRSSGSGLAAHADLRVEVPAGVAIAVYGGVGEAVARDLRGDLTLDLGSGSIRAEGIRGDVSMDTGSGGVRASGIRGSLSVDTGSGSVEMEDVEGAVVGVDTGSGRVAGRQVRAERFEVDTGSGRVEFTDLSAPDVLVDTGSGGVELELVGEVRSLDVDTGSGSVTVRLPRDVDAEIEVDTGAGRIEVDLPVNVRRMRRDYFRGRAGAGGGSIRIDTGSGSVRLLGG